MGALVQQNAAAFTGPGGAPVTGIVIALGTVPVGDNPDGPADSSVLAGVHQLPHFAVYVVGTLVKHHAENHFRMLFGFLVHLPDLFGIDAGRLLAHDVKAAFHAFNGVFGMVIMGNTDMAGIDET